MNTKIFGVTFIIFLVTFSTVFFYRKSQVHNLLYPNVFIDSIDFGLKNKEQLSALYKEKQRQLDNTVFFVEYKNDQIATFSAQMLHLRYNTDELYEQVYWVGRSNHIPSRYLQQLLTIFRIKKYFFTTQVTYDRSVLEEFISNLSENYNIEPKNALFTFENGKVTQFSEEKNGLVILHTQFLFDSKKQISNLKNRYQKINKLIVKDKIVKPAITLAQANQQGIEELIGEGQSNFSHSIPERIHNLTLATSKLHGVIIPRNSTFSFTQTVGDISRLTGYKPAYIIKGGKTVLDDGGGVCQVSTTLFRTTLNTGLPILEHHPHAYRVSYYENDSKPGLDATIFAPNVDLKFKNDTDSNILIQTKIDPENYLLSIKFYGKKDGRTVDLSPVTLYDVQPPPPSVFQDDPTLQKGVTKQVDFAAWGGKTQFDYKVIRDGLTIFEKKFYANYRPWQAVFLVGTKE